MNQQAYIWQWLTATLCIVILGTWSANANQGEWEKQDVNLRLGGNLRIISIKTPVTGAQTMQNSVPLESTPHPEPPLAGFSPLVAITTSDSRDSNDFNLEHILQNSYVGWPLKPEATGKYIIGICDSGAVLDLVAEPYSATLGLEGDYLTSNTIPLGGVGGSVDALLTVPLGIFAAGLSAIQPDGQLDLTQVIGHTNVSIAVAPPINCGTESVTGVIGTPLLTFFTTVIRCDMPQTITHEGQTYNSPNVQFFNPGDPEIPYYPRKITMEFGGLAPVTTAAFYAEFDPYTFEMGDPTYPTMLIMFPLTLPTGGAFFSQIDLLEGELSPGNLPETIRVMVDTGAQTSIISEGTAANLSLPATPDFLVDVCGLGGIVENVHGYYIDYVKIDAMDGALEFSNAPFVVIDLPSPEGDVLDGVLGMNFFWNRNVIYEPYLTASAFLRVSDPIPFAYGDFDRDFDVDQDDFDIFQGCATGPSVPITDPACNHIDADDDDDIDQEDFGVFQICYSGQDVSADPNCVN